MTSKLVIAGVSVKIVKEIPLSINYAIADIRDLSKRGGSLTKTVNLLATQEVNILFENIYRLNIELSTFDPNLKEEAVYYVNEKDQFKGDIQLVKIIDNPNGSREYQCQITGREGSIFVAIGDKLLTDIDFSNLDHTYNKTEQKNSWATSYRLGGVATAFAYGSGYTYPMIKYGQTASDSIVDVNFFKPAIYVKEYVDRIFAAAGFTYTSTFLNSAFFKRLVVPCNRDKIELTNAAISNSQYYIGKTATAPATYQNGNTVGNVAALGQQVIPPNYNLETSPYFDAGAQYDSAVNFYSTVANSGVYNVVAYLRYDLTVDAVSLPGGSWTSDIPSLTYARVIIEINTGSGWVIVANIANVGTQTNQALGTSKAYSETAQTGNIYLAAGTLVRVRGSIAASNVTLYDAASAPAPNGTAFTSTYVIPNGTTKNTTYLLRTDTSVADGNALAMNNTIPVNVKQKDFILSLCQMFNLYIEKDKTLDTNLIIEDRESFYSATVDDWTDLIDYAKPFEIKPMGELDARNYIWKYKDDKDYYNDMYQKQYLDNYGLKRHQVTNDFIKAEKKTELIFSPTPLVSNSVNNIICPHIYTKDGVNLKPLSHNIRILYYGGLKSSGTPWSYTSSVAGTSSETSYPYAGHLDDPLAPTIDLNFNYPKQTYYTYPLAYLTTNNLYNARYSKFINEITDKDSKLITCSVRLNEVLIQNFTFRNKIFFTHPEYGGTYFIVNKIIDYDPLNTETTKVELLKLKRYSSFVPGTIVIDPGDDTSSSLRIGYNPEVNTNANNNEGNTLALGSSNRVQGVGNSASGERNYIDETSSRVTLINCVECSAVGVTNFVGIGLSNRVIDSTYDNMTLNGTKEVWETKTANFNIESGKDYYVDLTAGDITATWDFTNSASRTITLIRIDNTGGRKLYIDELSGVATLKGVGVPVDLKAKQWNSFSINNNGTNFLIK